MYLILLQIPRVKPGNPASILIVDRTNYTIHIVYNLLHVMLDDNLLLLYGPQIVMYYLYVYDAVESGIKQLN